MPAFAGMTDAILDSHLCSIPDKIVADDRFLKQILNNQLSNATKFTPQGGFIHIMAKSHHSG
jgi:signal transduction histidine kinase